MKNPLRKLWIPLVLPMEIYIHYLYTKIIIAKNYLLHNGLNASQTLPVLATPPWWIRQGKEIDHQRLDLDELIFTSLNG
jgi:hypothetical protein